MSAPAVVPAPTALSAVDGPPFRLTDEVIVSGEADAVAALQQLVTTRTGAELRRFGGESGSAPGRRSDREAAAPSIRLTLTAGGPAESYRLTVTEDVVAINGADAAGLFYGVQTLGQLIARDGERWVVPVTEIDDVPRFAYRGVMLDVARHFHGVDTVKAYIDRAASLKFNHLHLHLTDDQGWRLEIASRRLLTELSSDSAVGGDPGGFFTQADYRDIVAYAASRHMTVVPEIDMPGHTHAVSLAYPELSEEPVISEHIREIARDYGGELPVNGVDYDGMAVGFSSLKINDEATYEFLADVLGEVAALNPGPYLHVGGDEALGTAPEDFAVFMARATEIVAGLGKTPITWHEAGAATGLAPTTVGQYWGFVTPTDGMDEKTRTFVRNGARVIMSPADAIYLDMKFDADSSLGLTWARGVTSAQRAYEWDPAEVIDGVGEADILGVEAPLWTETVRTLDDIDALAFPRIAAAAEAAWSPALGSTEQRSWESFRHRVGALGPLWSSMGIGYTPLAGIEWSTG
ncbi:beta-N-acetylhexosaminidase [Microbacterium invictum]|uniref:beta-N-acetylhexosaminidase n=1 Tax=Microbacterium invictum TaxID=515415 RepID=UPI0016109BA4